MSKKISKRAATAGGVVTGWFLIFVALVLLICGKQSFTTGISGCEVVMFAGLWLLSAATAMYFVVQLEGTIAGLDKKLEEEKRDRHHLQAQFEESIEKRTFELQRVNGALNREIAERTQAEEEVRELQKQLTLILDSAGEGILGLDNKGRVTFMNTAASLMLGWEPEELIGETHHARIHHTYPDGTSHPREQCPIYMAYKDGKVHYKTGDVFWSKNGTSFPVEYVSTPIRDRGLLTGAVVVFRDMNTFA